MLIEVPIIAGLGYGSPFRLWGAWVNPAAAYLDPVGRLWHKGGDAYTCMLVTLIISTKGVLMIKIIGIISSPH